MRWRELRPRAAGPAGSAASASRPRPALRAEGTREHEARIEAQRQQASLTGARDAALERVHELADREKAAQAVIQDLRSRLDAQIEQARTAGADLARLTEASKRLSDENERARAAIAQRETLANQASLEHRERVAALEEELRAARAALDRARQDAKDDAVVRARLEAHEEARREARTPKTK